MKKWISSIILCGLFFSTVGLAAADTNSQDAEVTPPNAIIATYGDASPSLGVPGVTGFDTKHGGFYVSSKDGFYDSHIYGYIQLQGDMYDGDTFTANNTNNFHNNLFIPSARLYDVGKIAGVWGYQFSYDFAGSEIKYADIQYLGFHHVVITAGQYKPAITAEVLQDRPATTFFERSLPAYAFIPDYVIGTQGLIYTNNATAAVGMVTPDQKNQSLGVTTRGGDPIGATTRLSYAPYFDNTDGRGINLGVGGYYQHTDYQHIVDFSSIPEIKERANSVLVDTGSIANSDAVLVNTAETRAVYDSFSMGGEYYHTNLTRFGASDLDFSGAYASFSYFFTGEHKEYDMKTGTFHTSHIVHSYGAWEAAARYSYLNLDDQNIVGGLEKDTTFALYWLPRAQIKTGITYIFADATPSSNGLNRHMNIIGLLLEAAF